MKVGEIERGVDLVPPGSGKKQYQKSIYPFSAMKKGESFVVTLEAGERLSRIRSRLSVACANNALDGRKYSLRTESPTTIRIYRVR